MKRALFVALLALAACRSTPSTLRPNDVVVGPTKGGSGVAPAPCSEDAGDPATEEDAFGKKVAMICIEGVRADARKAIQTALGFEAGAVLTEKALREGLEAIHRTGIVDDATAYAWKLGAGVVLSVRLHERPRVAKVTVDGASTVNVEVKQASEPTPLHPGQHFDPVYARERASALRDGYVTAGFEDATVTPETKPAGEGLVDVHMVIHEGEQSRIGTITTKGVSPSLEAGLIRASELVRGEPLGPDVLSLASLRVTAFYYETGNVSANARVDRGTKAADSSVPITVVVTEGPVFKVGKIHLEKSDLDAASTQRLLASLQTKSGAVFRRSLLVADIAAVKHSFADRGRTVEIEPATELNQTKHTIDIALEISAP